MHQVSGGHLKGPEPEFEIRTEWNLLDCPKVVREGNIRRRVISKLLWERALISVISVSVECREAVIIFKGDDSEVKTQKRTQIVVTVHYS